MSTAAPNNTGSGDTRGIACFEIVAYTPAQPADLPVELKKISFAGKLEPHALLFA
jgi:hypothetical protein